MQMLIYLDHDPLHESHQQLNDLLSKGWKVSGTTVNHTNDLVVLIEIDDQSQAANYRAEKVSKKKNSFLEWCSSKFLQLSLANRIINYRSNSEFAVRTGTQFNTGRG